MGKEQSLQQMVLGKLHIHMQQNEIGHLSYTIYKLNSKWIKDLNLRAKTKKFLEENIGANLYHLGFGNDFLNMIPKAHATKEKTTLIGLY